MNTSFKEVFTCSLAELGKQNPNEDSEQSRLCKWLEDSSESSFSNGSQAMRTRYEKAYMVFVSMLVADFAGSIARFNPNDTSWSDNMDEMLVILICEAMEELGYWKD